VAAFVRTKFVNNFRNLPPDTRQLLIEAQGPGDTNGLRSLAQVLRQPDFIIEGTTDSNTAVLNAGAAQSYMMKLVSEGGVQFQDGFDRDIEVKCWTRDESGLNFQHFKQTVRGGATNPSLVNGVRNLCPNGVGGRCTFANSGTDIVAADAWGGFSVTLDATAPGRFAAAIPKARRVLANLQLGVIGTGNGTDALVASLNAINLGTGVIELGIRAADDGANIAPADTMQLYASFDVLPVESPELVIETAATPDEVLVGALGQASENVTWLAHIYVGQPVANSASASSD
jgi:hypothetical protein